jgi:predicted transcriptional regulator
VDYKQQSKKNTAMNNSELTLITLIIADNIKHLRAELGISQEELAHRAGVDRTFLSRIERAQANPSLNKYRRSIQYSSCSTFI